MPHTCPTCSRPAEGRFCPDCGTALASLESCAACGASLPEGASFCNQCGTRVGAPAGAPAGDPVRDPARAPAGAARRDSNLPWIITGLALVGLIAVLILPRLGRDEPAVTAAPPAVGDASSVDLSSMTPREAADRLFNRVMTSVAAGDTAEARTFLPMAIAAYGRVQPLDLDGRYHLAVLHLVGDDAVAAQAQADSILAVEPTHLFGLFSAAQAQLAVGDEDAARQLFSEFLEVYDSEMARGLSGYEDHANALPVMREEAQQQVGS